MSGLVLFEGLPGSGKSTNASDLATWLTQGGAVVDHGPESRSDHPVDLDQVAVLTDRDRERLGAAGPGWDRMLSEAVEPTDGALLVRSPHERDLPSALKVALQDLEVYDGDIDPELHGRVLRESWRQFSAAVPQRQSRSGSAFLSRTLSARSSHGSTVHTTSSPTTCDLSPRPSSIRIRHSSTSILVTRKRS